MKTPKEIAAALAAITSALAKALEAAAMLANKADGLDSGEVSDLGCDACFWIERAAQVTAEVQS